MAAVIENVARDIIVNYALFTFLGFVIGVLLERKIRFIIHPEEKNE